MKPISDRTTIAHLKKALARNSRLAHLAPYVAGGLKIIYYAFDALEAGHKIKPPRGMDIGEISIIAKNPSSPKVKGEIAAAAWILEVVTDALNQ